MEERWYEDGLPFSCTACGNCCKSHGEYSHVYLREEEVLAMAAHLEMDPVEFTRQHLVVEKGWITLRPDLPQCQFLTPAGQCGVYEVRPVQCRTWPFWDVNLKPDVWKKEVNAICPGSREGEVHDADRIDAIADATEDWYQDRLEKWPGLEP
jgi:Fe-S-cluster containining protein